MWTYTPHPRDRRVAALSIGNSEGIRFVPLPASVTSLHGVRCCRFRATRDEDHHTRLTKLLRWTFDLAHNEARLTSYPQNWTTTMTTVYYLRVSTKDQSVESQRQALGIPSDADPRTVFIDEGVSGAVDALARPGFAACVAYLRHGDVLRVAALDRLGRNAIDVQQTFGKLIGEGVIVDVLGMGVVAGDVGKLLVTILSGVAQLERARIAQRTEAGRQAAKASLAGPTKLTHRGKTSLGRPFSTDPAAIKAWREANGESQKNTADQFGVSLATVKRACAMTTVAFRNGTQIVR